MFSNLIILLNSFNFDENILMSKRVEGFSRLTKNEKIDWLLTNYLNDNLVDKEILTNYWNADTKLQALHDEFAENTLSNLYMPFGIAPNFLIDNQWYAIPMVIEESSVVAAASKSAKFWESRGGFHTEVMGLEKIGHVHFRFDGDGDLLKKKFEEDLKFKILEDIQTITEKMRARGGGVTSVELIDKREALEEYFQLLVCFDTQDAMGANFINTVLEKMAKTLEEYLLADDDFKEDNYQTILCILSNYTPNCLVRAEVKCPVKELAIDPKEAELFVQKFVYALAIADVETYRATTHNKGIMNGVDAVVLATGNDFRAVEACAHTYASRNGKYQSLTQCEVKDEMFRFWLDLPIAMGTVGGLTALHPLVKVAFKILGNPDAKRLMGITAVAGLAQNFAALRSMVTSGIQQGHMKMHLFNILNQLEASQEEKAYFLDFFRDKVVSYRLVEEELIRLRSR